MARDKVDRWCRFRTVKQAAAATDHFNFADALGQRQKVKGGKSDPIAGQRNTIHQYGDEFRFLRITETAITEIELSWCVLFSDEQPGRFNEEFLLVVVHDHGLVIKLDHGCLL